ncbi:MAG: hypothetical protein ACM37W_06595 [Actinomycetota bacterium]
MMNLVGCDRQIYLSGSMLQQKSNCILVRCCCDRPIVVMAQFSLFEVAPVHLEAVSRMLQRKKFRQSWQSADQNSTP